MNEVSKKLFNNEVRGASGLVNTLICFGKVTYLQRVWTLYGDPYPKSLPYAHLPFGFPKAHHLQENCNHKHSVFLSSGSCSANYWILKGDDGNPVFVPSEVEVLRESGDLLSALETKVVFGDCALNLWNLTLIPSTVNGVKIELRQWTPTWWQPIIRMIQWPLLPGVLSPPPPRRPCYYKLTPS